MDKIVKYQQIILELLEAYSAIPLSYPSGLRDEIVADTVRNHFQLISLETVLKPLKPVQIDTNHR